MIRQRLMIVAGMILCGLGEHLWAPWPRLGADVSCERCGISYMRWWCGR